MPNDNYFKITECDELLENKLVIILSLTFLTFEFNLFFKYWKHINKVLSANIFQVTQVNKTVTASNQWMEN